MNTQLITPIGGPAPPEVHLPNAPLIKVLAQTRFSSVLRIDTKEGVTAFQEAIRNDFPFFTQVTTQEFQVQIGPGIPGLQQNSKNIWRFTNADKTWHVNLGVDSISLETEKYISRQDFVTRMAAILKAVEEVFRPQIVIRVGMRFIDRLTGKALEQIKDMINLNVAGIAALPIREHVVQALTEARLKVEEGQMTLRWGLLPKNGTPIPNLIKPINEISWILDIDAFSLEQRKFSHSELALAFGRLSERAYSMFRYMTTDEFLRYYGGKP